MDRPKWLAARAPLVLGCLITLTGAAVVACDGPAPFGGALTPTTPGPPVSRIEMAGPSSVPPGETVQLTAIAHLADGSTRDVTGEAPWFTSNPLVLTVVDGRVTGHHIGEAMVSVNFGAGRVQRETVVVPAGTFRLVGLVTEADPPSSPIVGAVVAVSGSQLSTITELDGRYKLYGVGGDIELRITKDGYQPYATAHRATEHATVNAQLRLVNPRRDLSGVYTLTIAAANDCRLDLPADLRERTYIATVNLSGNQIDVRLTGAAFETGPADQGRRFYGRAEPNQLEFILTPFDPFATYYGRFQGDLIETLSTSTYLVISGRAVVTESGSGYSGTLSGAIVMLTGNLLFFPKATAECRSANHRFVLRM